MFVAIVDCDCFNVYSFPCYPVVSRNIIFDYFFLSNIFNLKNLPISDQYYSNDQTITKNCRWFGIFNK
jgi:hypothetical protein